MKMSDFLNEDSISELARKTVEVGNVYRMNMTQSNGIIPKAGDTSRNKYFVVLGFDCNGIVYGGVIINSEINRNLPVHLKMLHMPIKKAKYDFLDHDSFVDCVSLKRAFPQKFNEWDYLGKIDDYDVSLIIGTVKDSPRESPGNLSKYGL